MSGAVGPAGLVVLAGLVMLQAPLPVPDMQPNVSLWGVFGWALLNPAVAIVGWAFGRRAHQPTELGIAAFAAAIAGVGLLWIAAWFRLDIASEVGRAGAGVFVMALPCGAAWAWLARRHSGKGRDDHV